MCEQNRSMIKQEINSMSFNFRLKQQQEQMHQKQLIKQVLDSQFYEVTMPFLQQYTNTIQKYQSDIYGNFQSQLMQQQQLIDQ